MKILHWKLHRELPVIFAFLYWQKREFTTEDNILTLAESNGTNVPIIYDKDGKRIARGFQSGLQQAEAVGEG